MHRRIAVVLLLTAALAGCTGDDSGTFELRGTFDENATDEQMDELQQEVEDRGGNVSFLESLPVQFHAWNLNPDACEEVKAFAEEADYVKDVGECQLDQDTTGGDEPTSNGS